MVGRTAGLLWATLLLAVLPQVSWGLPPITEVTSLGLSRLEDTTYLTVMANRAVDGRVTPVQAEGKTHLLVAFPLARAGRLPAQLAGDGVLVQRLRTEVSTGRGVQVILEMIPERPYTFWRQGRILPNGHYAFIVGLKGERTAAWENPRPVRSSTAQETRPESRTEFEPQTSLASTSPGIASGGRLAELKSLMPKAARLLHYLENEGWHLSKKEDYDRPGKRFSQGFFLSNPKHPEMVVKIAYLPANAPGAPHISMVTLSLENLAGGTAAEYRHLRQWSFSQIKAKYEDIGDFFDEALKPLRVKLRQQCQQVAQREEVFLKGYASQAFPGNPQIADLVMKHLQEKVNPRFEGVQYTVSEEPLGILNLVDFTYLRAYYLDHGTGGG